MKFKPGVCRLFAAITSSHSVQCCIRWPALPLYVPILSFFNAYSASLSNSQLSLLAGGAFG